MKHVLVVDVGTGGVHACLVDPMGTISGNAYSEIAYIYDPEVQGYDLDAAGLFETVKKTVVDALAKAGVPGGDVAALTVTSQRHGCVFLDADDAVVAAFPNLDARSEAEVGELIPSGEEIFAVTARWPAPWFPAIRYLWLRRHRPGPHAATASMMMLNEYVVFRLTGERVSEWSNAAETMFFDITRREWSEPMRALFEAESLKLNRIVETGAVAGGLAAEIAGALGLGRVPVVMAASDTQSAALGCGEIDPGDVVVVNGSTTPLLMPLAEFKIDGGRRVYTDPYYGGQWAFEANCNQSGIIHRRLLDQLLGLVRRLPGQENLRREALYDLFAGPEADPNGIVMHWGPVVSNIGRAWRVPRLFVSGENDECNLFASIIPAFVENLAFAIHENVRQLWEIAGGRKGRIVLTGGGSRNQRLQKAIAALNSGKQTVITAELETTSRGAALQAWIAAGKYKDPADAYRAMDTSGWCRSIEPDKNPGLLERHAQWRNEQPV